MHTVKSLKNIIFNSFYWIAGVVFCMYLYCQMFFIDFDGNIAGTEDQRSFLYLFLVDDQKFYSLIFFLQKSIFFGGIYFIINFIFKKFVTSITLTSIGIIIVLSMFTKICIVDLKPNPKLAFGVDPEGNSFEYLSNPEFESYYSIFNCKSNVVNYEGYSKEKFIIRRKISLIENYLIPIFLYLFFKLYDWHERRENLINKLNYELHNKNKSTN